MALKVRIARVFPRKTNATPTDDLAFYSEPTMLFPPDVDVIHVSVSFTWDIPRAEYLAKQWGRVASVEIGGPAYNQPSGEFVPGRYLKPGYVITSRGCPNHCWFCSVWKREPKLIELPITDGWNVLDDNLLACSTTHILKVFGMLKTQKHPIEFTGGLEAKLLKHWHIEALSTIKLGQLFMAYDTPDDYEPLVYASRELINAGIIKPTSHKVRSYVLIGFPNDTFEKAEHRLKQTLALGIAPMAMLWRDESGKTEKEWRRFQRKWVKLQIIYSNK